jgi:class 3 adenylate cyclase
MPAAVETVTVLVTDLVESTRLASRVGPDAADALRQEHFALLREAIAAAGGHEVKTTGDGLMVVFAGAAGAVACAVAAQQALERRNRGAGERLAMRVGVALGDVTSDDGDVFGMPVVEAVRLCDAAAGGQILATDLVRIIGGRGGHPFRAVGELELHGLPEPVSAFEIGWEPDGGWGGDIPLPPRLRAAPADGYVGREPERERVRARWEAARAGARQALLVSGEPGIGKTRFATHAALECRADGAVVLFGHCAEEVGAPYGPWLEALGHLVDHAPDEALERHVERHGGELARLAPGLPRRVPSVPPPARTDPETERYLLFSAVVSLLEEAGAECPVVLVLDDLHWADAPTLALLKHVLCEAQAARVLVLAGYRDSDLSRRHPLTEVLADLRRVDGIERLPLRGLDAGAVAALMQLVAGHELDATGLALAREITAETGGNPFFVGELLRHLSESGALVRAADGRWELVPCLDELGLPQSVREVVHRRVERLGEDCRHALACAAVIGRDFDLELLAGVARRDDDELIDLLDRAVEASLLIEHAERPGSFSFAHNLINHTLYDALGAARRARLHRRVAEALEALCGDDPGPRVAELARHWTAATAPVEPGKALAYSRRAGERALAELAPGEAVRWFAQALELLGRARAEDDAERCDLAIGLGEAQRQAGRPEFRETLLGASRLAERLGDGDRAARAALANSRGFASTFGAVDAERVAALERALALNRDGDPARRARLLALQAMELQFDPGHERRRALADEALAVARTAADARVLPYVLRDHFHAVWSADTLPGRLRTAEEMTELARRGDDPLAQIWALDRTVHAAAEAGALRRAAEASSLLIAQTEELGQPGLRWHATYYAAGLVQLRGDLAESERLSEAARDLGERAGEPDAIVVYLGQICAVRAEQGRGEEIVELLEQASAATPGIPAFEAGLATVLCDLGRADEAAPRLERAVRRGFGTVPRDQVCSTALTTWARAAADLGDERAAAALYDLLAPWRDLLVWNGAQGYGAVATYLGMLAATLGAHDRAAEHFAAASAIHRREGIAGWETRNLVYRARSLAAAGDAERARATAERALSMARGGASPGSARHAEALLRETAGVPARR